MCGRGQGERVRERESSDEKRNRETFPAEDDAGAQSKSKHREADVRDKGRCGMFPAEGMEGAGDMTPLT